MLMFEHVPSFRRPFVSRIYAFVALCLVVLVSDIAKSDPAELPCDHKCRMTKHAYICATGVYWVYTDETCTYCDGTANDFCFSGATYGGTCEDMTVFTVRRERYPADHCSCTDATGAIIMESGEPIAGNPTIPAGNPRRQICTPIDI